MIKCMYFVFQSYFDFLFNVVKHVSGLTAMLASIVCCFTVTVCPCDVNLQRTSSLSVGKTIQTKRNNVASPSWTSVSFQFRSRVWVKKKERGWTWRAVRSSSSSRSRTWSLTLLALPRSTGANFYSFKSSTKLLTPVRTNHWKSHWRFKK